MKDIYRLLVVCLAVAALCPAADAVRFFGTSSGAGPGSIYEIDTTAQTATFVFQPTDLAWFGATDSPIPHSFYATLSWYSGALYVINVVEQTVIPVGPYGADIIELAYDPVGGVLYGTDYVSLYTIDQTTGLATLVGSFNGPIDMWGLAYDDAQSKLFGADGGVVMDLYEVDTTTGNATLVGPTGGHRIHDLWYDSDDGTMYGVGDVPNQVYSVDTATGAATPLFAIEPWIWGLGKPISPSPVEDDSWGRIKSLFR